MQKGRQRQASAKILLDLRRQLHRLQGTPTQLEEVVSHVEVVPPQNVTPEIDEAGFEAAAREQSFLFTG